MNRPHPAWLDPLFDIVGPVLAAVLLLCAACGAKGGMPCVTIQQAGKQTVEPAASPGARITIVTLGKVRASHSQEQTKASGWSNTPSN